MKKIIRRIPAKFNLKDLLREIGRKILHVGSCAVALILVQQDWKVLEILFLPTMALGFWISERIDFFGKNISFGSKRKWGGIMLAVGLTVIMFSPAEYEVKKFAILNLMIADVMAAIIGKLVPIRKVEVLGAYKSIGGSLAFLAGIYIALSLSFGGTVNIWNYLITAMILGTLEFFNWRGIDNLSMPFMAIFLGTLLFT